MFIQMGSESEPVKEPSTAFKLSLFSLPTKPLEPSGTLTPPLRTRASIPFQWEEAPGKPRHHCSTIESKPSCARTLELPPRLLKEAKVIDFPFPTTALDSNGPEVGRSLSFTFSFRNTSESNWGKRVSKDGAGYLGSRRWGSFRKTKEAIAPRFEISSSCSTGFEKTVIGSGVGGCDNAKVKITRIRRRGSLLSLSNTKSHLLVSGKKKQILL